jgi:hypothetical protein
MQPPPASSKHGGHRGHDDAASLIRMSTLLPIATLDAAAEGRHVPLPTTTTVSAHPSADAASLGNSSVEAPAVDRIREKE